ncbi:acyl-homoserine-lactone synthase [Pararhizobium sp. PWRC1-1]|uniref:acyl-homoserine-lactone synthase n=1 Tax=Pararhizobium sp. PWRC1-1 TaxID=2804566 RepID=UPI003CF527AF
MLKLLTKRDQHDRAYNEMLRGRARVFRDRMNWNVDVIDGKEFDLYDRSGDPLYLISLDNTGNVLGSLRVLPTTGPTMLKREFALMFREPVNIESPTVWECTRFCVHAGAGDRMPKSRNIALQLLCGLCDLAHEFNIQGIVGVYELPMQRVYKRLGWSPRVLSTSWPRFGNICCGMWDVNPTIRDHLCNRVRMCGLETLAFQCSLHNDKSVRTNARVGRAG